MTREFSPGRVRVAEIVAGTSDPVCVNGLSPVTVYLDPDRESPGGTGKVQYTTTPLDGSVVAEDAVWRDWEAGDVEEATESVFDGPVTALRAVTVTGSDVYWEVVA